MSAFYNDNDPYVCAWLENLICAGHIAPGTVSSTSIADLVGRELAGVQQAHFFAGIGVWSAALRAAGWADDKPVSVWTGSCPCQPFSGAGKGQGFADKRHLWPSWFWLIEQHRPDTIFGEQVEGPAGRAWLDLVFTDLEGLGYACGATVFPAAGVGAPHRRHRTYWVANAQGLRFQEREWNRRISSATNQNGARQAISMGSSRAGFWRDADWIFCRDGYWRPVEPSAQPLAHGALARVGRLRAYGNAIVLQQAQAFIESFMEIEG